MAQSYEWFLALCKAAKLPQPVMEHRFHDKRRWRFDFAWPDYKVALEVEGGIWSGGRHTRGVGFIKDMEKYNKATLLGWRVLRIQPSELRALQTIDMIREAINLSPGKQLIDRSTQPQ
jgi:hypothetical protein